MVPIRTRRGTAYGPRPRPAGLGRSTAQPAGAHVKATAEEGLPCQWLHPPPLRAVVVVAPARYPRGRFDEWSESFRSVVSCSEPLPKRCSFLRSVSERVYIPAVRAPPPRLTPYGPPGPPGDAASRPAAETHLPNKESLPPTQRVGSGVPEWNMLAGLKNA